MKYLDQEPAQKQNLPTGPFGAAGASEDKGSLLIFVPRNAIGTVIDKMTGGYGYSHLAIDCGEVDIPSGRRVMIEATPALGVHIAFQDEYAERKFIRIPLKETGVEVDEFCDCIRSKLGEKYSDEEILTLGVIDDPVKQMCSDLATVCLPKETLIDIAHYYQTDFPQRLPEVRVYGRLDKKFHMFISPNGFSQYFGVPKGKQLEGADQLAKPVLPNKRIKAKGKSTFWMAGMGVLCALALIWIFIKLDFRISRNTP